MRNLLIVLLLAATCPLSAQTDSSLADTTWMVDLPQKSKTGLVIGEGESVTLQNGSDSNVVLMGSEVHVEAPVWADAVIFGGDIGIRDIITGDLTTTGGRIRISKPVGEDVRAVGGDISIMDTVYGNVVAVGGRVEIGAKSVVMGDALLVGGEINVEGQIHGKVHLRSGQGNINGTIQGGLDAKAGALDMNGSVHGRSRLAAEDIDIGEAAEFHSEVRYWTEGGEMEFGNALKGVSAIYDERLEPAWNFDWEWFGLGVILFWILTTLGGILLMALITLIFPDWIKRAGQKVQESPLKSLGIGVLYFLAVPVAAGILFVSLIGIPIAFIVVFLFGLTVLYALVFAAMAIAGWLAGRSEKDWSRWTLFGVSILVFIVLRLISFVPILGWIVAIGLVLIAFGGLISGLRKRREVQPA